MSRAIKQIFDTFSSLDECAAPCAVLLLFAVRRGCSSSINEPPQFASKAWKCGSNRPKYIDAMCRCKNGYINHGCSTMAFKDRYKREKERGRDGMKDYVPNEIFFFF